MRSTLVRLLTGVVLCSTAAAIGAGTVVANREGERTISLYNIHTKETLT